MTEWIRYPLQFLAYAAFAILLGALSQYPSYTYLAPDRAVIKLSVDRYGNLVNKCHKRTAAQLAALPSYQRLPVLCPRRRYPVKVALSIDDHVRYEQTRAPSGIHRDGPSYIYARLIVPAGKHSLRVRMWDNGKYGTPALQSASMVTLHAAQIFVIEFSTRRNTFLFE